jgi:cytochrome c553
MMKALISVAVLGLLAVPVVAAELPDWAYPTAPPAGAPLDNTVKKSLPGSTKQYTAAEINDRFGPPDWYPEDHPPMPDVVAHGKKPNAPACDLCHLTSGAGHPESAGIAGLPKDYILRQMAEFKAGIRKGMRAPVMVTIASALTDEETKAAADYFSSLKFPKWYKVVEADMVPKSYVGAGAMRLAVPDGGMEPIGNRIIELPQDEERTESRDSRAGHMAYVPVGSIKKGEELVKTGGNGKTVACEVCHGPDLKGMAFVPPIAGRSPEYIYRQLNDIKIGTRNGAMVPLMKAVVEKLTDEDMVAISAYLVSQEP